MGYSASSSSSDATLKLHEGLKPADTWTPGYLDLVLVVNTYILQALRWEQEEKDSRTSFSGQTPVGLL